MGSQNNNNQILNVVDDTSNQTGVITNSYNLMKSFSANLVGNLAGSWVKGNNPIQTTQEASQENLVENKDIKRTQKIVDKTFENTLKTSTNTNKNYTISS